MLTAFIALIPVLSKIFMLFFEGSDARSKANKELGESGAKLIEEGSKTGDVSRINAGFGRINRRVR